MSVLKPSKRQIRNIAKQMVVKWNDPEQALFYDPKSKTYTVCKKACVNQWDDDILIDDHICLPEYWGIDDDKVPTIKTLCELIEIFGEEYKVEDED